MSMPEKLLEEKVKTLEAQCSKLRDALKGLLDADGGDLRSYKSHPEDEEIGSELFIAVPKALQALSDGGVE